jgi:hypothetical protein
LRAETNGLNKFAYNRFVLRSEFQHLLLEKAGIGIDGKNSAITIFYEQETVVVENLPVLCRSEFFSEFVKTGSPLGAHKPVHCSVYNVALAFPTGTNASGFVVHFKNGCLIPVHPAIAARSEARKSPPIIIMLLSITDSCQENLIEYVEYNTMLKIRLPKSNEQNAARDCGNVRIGRE